MDDSLINRVKALEAQLEALSTKEGPCWRLISTQTVGAGGAASISFTSIPQGYKYLQFIGSLRANDAVNTRSLYMQVDATAAGYNWQRLYGLGATANASSAVGASGGYCGGIVGNSAAAGFFSGVDVKIYDYSNNSKAAHYLSQTQASFDATASNQLLFHAGGRIDTVWGVTQVVFYCDAGNFAQLSCISMYGIFG